MLAHLDRTAIRGAAPLLLVLALGALAGCHSESKTAAPAAASSTSPGTATATPAATPAESSIPWEDEVAAWKQHRRDRLEQPDGWLTLAGFAWLEEGDNSVGSDPKSQVRLPEGKAPARLGTLTRKGDAVIFTTAPGVSVTSDGAPVTTLPLKSDRAGAPTPLEHGPLTFFLIERAGRPAIRIRDRDSETLKRFTGMEYYPLDRAWRIEGRFEPADTVRELPIPNILGVDEMILSPGHVVFSVGGKEYRLLALDDTGDGRLFLVFGDPTNGKETYGGGRFLYTDPPVDGKVVIDFNRAYNPPCVFTPYATCPLPPKGNRLPLPIRAGEKKYALEAEHAGARTGAAAAAKTGG